MTRTQIIKMLSKAMTKADLKVGEKQMILIKIKESYKNGNIMSYDYVKLMRQYRELA